MLHPNRYVHRIFLPMERVGSCVPGQTLELGKPGIGHFEKTWIGIFSKYFENMPIHVFSKWPIPGFPSFRVWPGTQDPTRGACGQISTQGHCVNPKSRISGEVFAEGSAP